MKSKYRLDRDTAMAMQAADNKEKQGFGQKVKRGKLIKVKDVEDFDADQHCVVNPKKVWKTNDDVVKMKSQITEIEPGRLRTPGERCKANAKANRRTATVEAQPLAYMAEKPATTVLDGKNCDILEMIEKGQEQRSPDLSKYGDYKYVARYDEVCHEYGQGSSSGAEGCRESSLKWFRKMRCDLQTYVIGADVDADYQNDERLQNFCSLVPNDKRGILNPVPEDLYEYAFAKFPEVLDVYSILIVEYPGNKIGLYRMPEWNTRHELVYVIWCGVIQNPGFEADGIAQAFHKCTVCVDRARRQANFH